MKLIVILLVVIGSVYACGDPLLVPTIVSATLTGTLKGET
jgi:hypothetical protein